MLLVEAAKLLAGARIAKRDAEPHFDESFSVARGADQAASAPKGLDYTSL